MTGQVDLVSRYDGESIDVHEELAYELGSYLGGGAAGVVYEAKDVLHNRAVAIKILNPVGFKVVRSSMLARYTVVHEGVQLIDPTKLTRDNVYWLVNPVNKQLFAVTMDNKGNYRELTLPQCLLLWGNDLAALNRINKRSVKSSVPVKYLNYLQQREKIFKEIDTMRKVSGHVNVLQLYQVLELRQDTKATIFLVMELAAGGELFDRIRVDEGCDENVAVSFFKQLLDGMVYCHRKGVCHRDLKPENVLLSDSDDGSVLKIADFGLSAVLNDDASQRERGHTGLPKFSSVVGSPHYVAPEVLDTAEDGYDGTKADVWSLGVILYAMLAGKLPFGKDVLHCPRYRSFRLWHESYVRDPYTVVIDPSMNWFFPRGLSSSVVSLLIMMLDPNPATRISLADAQHHPWVQDSPIFDDLHTRQHLVHDGEDLEDDMLLFYNDEDEDDEEDVMSRLAKRESDDSKAPFRSSSASLRISSEALPQCSIVGSMERNPSISCLSTYGSPAPQLALASPQEETPQRALASPHEEMADGVRPSVNDDEAPIFNDVVKRSTRFTTAVPANEVMQRIKTILELNSYPSSKTPCDTSKSRLTYVDCDAYKLEVLRDNVCLFSVRLFFICPGTYMVEFIRGQMNIFEFKECYDDIRKTLSEIVQTDYTLNTLDEQYMM